MMEETFHVSPWVSGALMTAGTAIVILGGIKSIANVCEKLVPFMAVFYVAGCLVLLAMHASTLPETLRLIVTSAFTGQAAMGGFLGAGMKEAVRYGIARGLFSNESGLGSAPIVAAAAQTTTPVRQALVSSTGTFWDTVVVCAMTGLVVVNSGDWTAGLKGAALTKSAFGHPVVGPAVPMVGLSPRLLHHPRLGLLRREGGRAPGPGAIPLPGALGRRRDGGLGRVAAGGVGVRGRGERPHGGAEPDLAAVAHGRGRGRDAETPVGGLAVTSTAPAPGR
jgi:AGCS family alanine or glycine:cation symporter